MCKFFTVKSSALMAGFIGVLVPMVTMITAFSRDEPNENNLRILATIGFMCSAASLGFGYWAGKMNKCQLAHVVGNIVVEQENHGIEGAPNLIR
jgi:predicted histidine transporter YuiF (NhaC family)